VAGHQIKISGTADFSSITRQVKTLSGTINDAFGKDGVKLLDDNSLKFLKSEASNSLAQMRQQMTRLVDEAKKLDDEIESAVGHEKKQNELIQQRMKYTQQIVAMNRQIQGMSKTQGMVSGARSSSVMRGAGSAISEIGSRAGQVARSIPGVGGIAGVGQSAISAGAGAASVIGCFLRC
jgi:uncharacterized protein YdcH (DUF465 family)